MKMRSATLIVLLVLFGALTSYGQTLILEKARLGDRTTGKGITISLPASTSSAQTLKFPTTAGTVDQILGITSVSGSTVTLGWQSAGAASTTTSDRVPSDTTISFNGTAARPAVTASANKNYRLSGMLRGTRVTGAGSPSDNFKIKLIAPNGSTYTLLAVRCVNCESGTTGVPAVATGTTEATTATINPNGTSWVEKTFFFEGMVKVGNTSDVVKVVIVDDGTGNNTTKILEDSYLLLTEIE